MNRSWQKCAHRQNCAASDSHQQETARMYGTPLYVWKNGKVVAKKS
jgi:hypothetical protein